MSYTQEEIIQYIAEENVKFIRLAFTDIFGRQKNISIMPSELTRAFSTGIAFDAWSIVGYQACPTSDLFLHPDPATLAILPWRPEQGRVLRMFCNITHPDGTPFIGDTRYILEQAVKKAKSAGLDFYFGGEMEFYLFQLDENGNPTKIPYDRAGYMDIAPEDKGENIRREICLTLEQMGIMPESSHHEEGPGQNEIDFRYADPITAAEHTLTFIAVTKTVAARNGLYASFSPKPLSDAPGNGLHINFSARHTGGEATLPHLLAGVLAHVPAMTLFLNPLTESYKRLGKCKAPHYVSWARENRSQLVRVPAAFDKYCRGELRSPDPAANPYIAYALVIYAGLDGFEQNLQPPAESTAKMFIEEPSALEQYPPLPSSLKEAQQLARRSDFIAAHLPELVINAYCES